MTSSLVEFLSDIQMSEECSQRHVQKLNMAECRHPFNSSQHHLRDTLQDHRLTRILTCFLHRIKHVLMQINFNNIQIKQITSKGSTITLSAVQESIPVLKNRLVCMNWAFMTFPLLRRKSPGVVACLLKGMSQRPLKYIALTRTICVLMPSESAKNNSFVNLIGFV